MSVGVVAESVRTGLGSRQVLVGLADESCQVCVREREREEP